MDQTMFVELIYPGRQWVTSSLLGGFVFQKVDSKIGSLLSVQEREQSICSRGGIPWLVNPSTANPPPHRLKPLGSHVVGKSLVPFWYMSLDDDPLGDRRLWRGADSVVLPFRSKLVIFVKALR